MNKEGLENLPPEKRKKKFEAKIHDIQVSCKPSKALRVLHSRPQREGVLQVTTAVLLGGVLRVLHPRGGGSYPSYKEGVLRVLHPRGGSYPSYKEGVLRPGSSIPGGGLTLPTRRGC